MPHATTEPLEPPSAALPYSIISGIAVSTPASCRIMARSSWERPAPSPALTDSPLMPIFSSSVLTALLPQALMAVTITTIVTPTVMLPTVSRVRRKRRVRLRSAL